MAWSARAWPRPIIRGRCGNSETPWRLERLCRTKRTSSSRVRPEDRVRHGRVGAVWRLRRRVLRHFELVDHRPFADQVVDRAQIGVPAPAGLVLGDRSRCSRRETGSPPRCRSGSPGSRRARRYRGAATNNPPSRSLSRRWRSMVSATAASLHAPADRLDHVVFPRFRSDRRRADGLRATRHQRTTGDEPVRLMHHLLFGHDIGTCCWPGCGRPSAFTPAETRPGASASAAAQDAAIGCRYQGRQEEVGLQGGHRRGVAAA